MPVVEESESNGMKKAPGLIRRVRVRLREMPGLLKITAINFFLLPTILIVLIVVAVVRETVVHKQPVPPDTWWGAVILPLYVVPIFTIPGLIYHRPVFARAGLLALAAGFYGCLVKVTAWQHGVPGALWEYAVVALLLVGFPIYYLYFRKNVVAYFRRGKKEKTEEAVP